MWLKRLETKIAALAMITQHWQTYSLFKSHGFRFVHGFNVSISIKKNPKGKSSA